MLFKRFFVLLFLFCGFSSFSQSEADTTMFRKFYKIGEKEEIFVPLGKIAFADSVVAFNPGRPTSKPPYNDPQKSLGEPDYTTYQTNNPKYVSIGCGGVLTVQFTDNGFIDIEGPDLVFFEVGPSIEPFRLEISSDGKKWYDLGRVSGGKATVDIANFVRPTEPKEIYYYVRITDLKRFCKGPTPGSDIDAIGAIGAVIKLSLDAKVLFDYDEFSLRDEAVESLNILLRQLAEIPKAEITISGHTDADGSQSYNRILGKNRAVSVQNYLKRNLKGKGDYTYKIKSYGKEKPVRENTTDDGKQQNRRVEIIVIPDKDFYVAPKRKKK